MLSLNLGTLDSSAKRALEISLRPKFMHLIEPWVLRSTESEKRLLVSLLSQRNPQTAPLAPNDLGVLLPTPSFSIDAVQSSTVSPPVRALGVFPTSPIVSDPEVKIIKRDELLHAARNRPLTKVGLAFLNKETTSRLTAWQISNAGSRSLEGGKVTALLKSLSKLGSETLNRSDIADPFERLSQDSINHRLVKEKTAGIIHPPKKTVQIKSLPVRDHSRVVARTIPVKSTYSASFTDIRIPNWMDQN